MNLHESLSHAPTVSMIVRPDFPDHYKTRMLVDMTGDNGAPVMLLRLWAHCQVSQTSRFRNLSPAALRAICQANSLTAERWREILLQTRFIEIDGDETVVHEWDEFNAQLLRNWENGRKGGRPPGKSRGRGEVGSPGVSPTDQGVSPDVPPVDKRHQKNPEETLGFAWVNPEETDKIREEKRREDQREEGKPSLPSGDGEVRATGEVGSPGVSPTDQGVSPDVPPVDKRTVLDEIVHLFHTLCPTLPRVRKVEGQRLKAVRARWRSAPGKTDAEKLEWFRQVFSIAGTSRKLSQSDWCSFDWLVTPRYSTRVLEGNYSNDRAALTRKPKFDTP